MRRGRVSGFANDDVLELFKSDVEVAAASSHSSSARCESLGETLKQAIGTYHIFEPGYLTDEQYKREMYQWKIR